MPNALAPHFLAQDPPQIDARHAEEKEPGTAMHQDVEIVLAAHPLATTPKPDELSPKVGLRKEGRQA